jgi:CO/xanthine dehydrogenase Mo-binding subunit
MASSSDKRAQRKHGISRSVIKKDHTEKMNGSVRYVGDYPTDGMLHGAILRSKIAHGKIVKIVYPELPDGYFIVDYRDITGCNSVHIIEDDSLVFAVDEVCFIGDHISMIVGTDDKKVYELVADTQVEYEELPAVLSIDEASEYFYQCDFGRGDVDGAFIQADKIYDECFQTGYQEQGYLETQGMIGDFDGETLTIHGSLQCPYYVHAAVAASSGLAKDKVRIIQDVTGGGFGGKEAYPSILAAQVGAAAMKAGGKSVRVLFSRREDMEFTSKRHPSRTHIRLAVKDGRVSALDVDFRLNAGAYSTLSMAITQRGSIAAPGVYCIPNLRVSGKACKTNTVPNGAYRGFGAPQTFFAIEMIMTHVAKDLGLEPIQFKREHLVKQGDYSSTDGKYHFPVPLPEMLDKLESASDYRRKHTLCSQIQQGRYRRGIGSAIWFHGAGYTGSGERDFIKAVVALQKNTDDRVEILTANTDMGQGIKTTFSKIVAHELGVPYDQVSIGNPDTFEVPDSGPTVASRSLMTVGELLRRAAGRLREEWVDGQEQLIEERYKEPDFMIPFSLNTFAGDAYPTYAWGVAAVEVELDVFTGSNQIIGCWTVFDVGTPVDENIVIGQMEGGALQGLGYASMEQMACDGKGRINNRSYSDYLIPTACDIGILDVQLHVEEFPFGPYGAKGAGELPLVGLAPAFLEAIEQCLGQTDQHHIPFTAEDAITELARTAGKVVGNSSGSLHGFPVKKGGA